MGIFDIDNNLVPIVYKSIFKGKKRNYLTNEKIFEKGILCSSIAIINSGSVMEDIKIDNITIFKKRHNINEIIGLSIIFSSNPFFDTTYYSETNTTVTLISKDELFNLMNKDKKFLLTILDYISNENIKLKYINIIYSIKDHFIRVCYYLYLESIYNKSNEFIIKYTHNNLACCLNITIKELKISIKTLISLNILKTTNKLYKITSKEALKAKIMGIAI